MRKEYYRKAKVPVRKKGFVSNLGDKLHAYLDIHAHAFFSSLGRLVRAPFSSIMTIAVMSIAIALSAGFYLFVANIQQLTDSFEDSNHMSVFLKEQVSDQAGAKLAETLRSYGNIKDTKLISRSQALTEFREYSGFGAAIDALDKNPLPAVIQVMPSSESMTQQQLEQLRHTLSQLPEVDQVQLDLEWVKRLQSMLALAERGVTLLSTIFGIGVLFITGNTIRLELHNRREEVIIAKLVGATDRFISRPFLYTGFWLGLLSGITAWLIVTMMMMVLQTPVDELSKLYDGLFNVLYLGFIEVMALFGISTLLGVSGAWLVLVYQLRQLNPE
ncbi:MAG: permease-like cell division protein FtsX [Methylicorpusculum sp.]|uniref:permease-like cell division protein FtsX n=1 Tax=Methylicorpusculum sp. TaxID=2713644 RepID=UPI00271F894E|nr:permease-like cell division protein FtsX [Methylicorpusculum sp.]MDO8845953.1 permease-like cell division protein FtsX [Methylicorpusculum sp.]MDO8938559.1 permease-like cell division protein FtsX [Methylicorpusculum sp.]MDO9238846.1 permease-like cell division protein FtsX [Methylicorpusculum sp.]MDP2202109.1 permease-like cell division protein FtsX [Methylicorpusculum sp.]